MPVTRMPVAPCDRSRKRGESPKRAEWGLLAAVAAFSFLMVFLVGLFALDGGSASVPDGTSTVQVRAGETLWELATRFAPDSDTHAVVRRIVELNDLDGTAVAVGESLEVPTGA